MQQVFCKEISSPQTTPFEVLKVKTGLKTSFVAGAEAEGLLQIATSTVTRSASAASAMVSANSSSTKNVKSNGSGGGGGGGTPGRRKKPTLSSRERNVRRIESNERERLRMHGLNEAFQVSGKILPSLQFWVQFM